MTRFSRVLLVLSLFAVSSFGQDRSLWRTAADVRDGSRGSIVGTVVDTLESRNELQLEPDDDRARVTVMGDSVTTQYNGFGGMINGKPEIFTGTAGFANVRIGDRIEVRGIARGTGTVAADQITLLGRSVPAPQTGVGTTRAPSSPSTPGTVPSTSQRIGRTEGIVRQVNATEGRLVIETDRREMVSVTASSNVPVYYRNNTYRLSNLEVGDRVRIEPDSMNNSGEVRARSIDVLQSVQEGGNRIGSLSGRVTRVDSNLDMIRIQAERGEVRVDVATAVDETGRRIRAADVHSGDQADLTGRYGPTGDVFIASTVRLTRSRDVPGENVFGELASVTIYGTVREILDTSGRLLVRDAGGREYSINALEDFVVKTKSGTYTTADHVKVGDAVVVKAYRDADGNYIAQTIRIR